ncbi:MAG: S8 family serine peptidase [Bdellovibrionales bacterium]|nr:S8 family serine peptidase [Bdellovibrionales bacterium]
MEVKKTWGSILLALITVIQLAACSKKKDGVTEVSENSACKARTIAGQYIVKYLDRRIEKVLAKNDADLFDRVLKGKTHLIEYVERNYSVPLSDAKVEANFVDDETWGFDAVRAQSVWDQNVFGQGVVVAVVDTGVDTTHPQLQTQLWKNQAELNGTPGVDDDGNGFVDDVYGWDFANNVPAKEDDVGHGTHVAGIIAANPNAGVVKGVAPQAKIMAVDFMNQFGGSDADAVAALEYAANNGAQIINASWGSAYCSQAVQDKFVELKDRGIFVAVAAGNSGNDITYQPEFPAAYNSPSQLTVGASTVEFYRAIFSNYGLPVHIVAPGKDILSTVPGWKSPSGYAYMSGTSMATPFVAGVAALLLSYDPVLSYSTIKTAIQRSVAPGHFNVRYNGELRADGALEYIKSLP